MVNLVLVEYVQLNNFVNKMGNLNESQYRDIQIKQLYGESYAHAYMQTQQG
jgi:hypothetical protein